MTSFSLAGRAALVTGASRGIGAATARALDDSGARVALVARSEEALGEVAAGLTNDPVVIVADLTADGAPGEVAARALAELGRVDILVNNAAIGVRTDSTSLDAVAIDQILRLNVRNLLLLTTALIPSMVAQAGGAVVNI